MNVEGKKGKERGEARGSRNDSGRRKTFMKSLFMIIRNLEKKTDENCLDN